MILALVVFSLGLALALVGAAGLLVSWLTRRGTVARLRVAFCAALGIGLLLALSCAECRVWDGDYLQAEFQLVFKDLSGRPIEGVELRVEDGEGRNYFHYPVSDYLPGQIPASDRGGAMVFHHVSDGAEFSGKTYYVLFVIPVRDPPAPVFVCRFLYNGREVHRVPFSDLARWQGTRERAPWVKRRWKWPVWPESQLLMRPDGSVEDPRDRKLRLFDLNGDGKLNPEEAAASRAATSNRAEQVARAQLRGADVQEHLEFAIVHKAIAVSPDPERRE